MATTKRAARRTQQERTEATTARLLSAARELFATQGYAATSIEQIAAEAAVTKGALYHHFQSKRDIFFGVCEQEQARLTELQAAGFSSKRDPWEGFKRGCEAYLEAATDPAVQQIMLLDAPVVLGWEGMRELEEGTHAMAAEALKLAMQAKRIARRSPGPLVDLLFGAIGAAATTIARAEDQAAAQRVSVRELRRLLDGLTIS
jgi:AcrR family transcriptional regulator